MPWLISFKTISIHWWDLALCYREVKGWGKKLTSRKDILRTKFHLVRFFWPTLISWIRTTLLNWMFVSTWSPIQLLPQSKVIFSGDLGRSGVISLWSSQDLIKYFWIKIPIRNDFERNYLKIHIPPFCMNQPSALCSFRDHKICWNPWKSLANGASSRFYTDNRSR